MTWQEIDEKLHAEGWSLQLLHGHGQWQVFFGHQAYLPAAGKADTIQEAIEIAYKKIKERGDA